MIKLILINIHNDNIIYYNKIYNIKKRSSSISNQKEISNKQ